MIKINEKKHVSGVDIFNTVEVKTRYYDWIKRCIDYADLKENIDFFKTVKDNTVGRPSTEYTFTLDAAKEICIVSATSKAKELRRWLIELSNKAENLELISVKQAAFAFKVINCLKFISNQKEAFNEHQKVYISENPDTKYIYSEFAKYRAKIIGWDKEKTNEAIEKFLSENVGYPKNKLRKANMQTQLSVIDIGEAIRVAVLDILYSKHENNDLSDKFSILCKNLANEMEVKPEKENKSNLFKDKEMIDTVKQIELPK